MNRRRQVAVISLIVLFDLLGFGLIIPQLGVYAKLYQASAATQGLLIASYSIMQFLFAPLLGRWSDRIGRRPVLIISLATSLLGHVLFAMSRDLTLLFVSRLIDGLGGANVSTAQAYLSDVTPPERRASAMGMIGASFGLGFVLGPTIGALAGPWGIRLWGPHGGSIAIGSLAALASLVTLVLAVAALPESLPAEERGARSTPLRLLDLSALRTAGQRPQLVRLLLIYLVSTAGFAVLHAIMTYFVLDTLQVTVSRAPEQAARLTGYVFAWIGILAIAVQGGAIRPLVKRFGEARLLLAGLGLLAAALAVLPAAHGLGMLLLVTTPLAVGNALCSANLPALLTFHSPAPQRGEILGVSQSLGSIGRIIGPLAGGALYDVGRAVPFWAGAVLCAVAVVLAAGLPANRPEETL